MKYKYNMQVWHFCLFIMFIFKVGLFDCLLHCLPHILETCETTIPPLHRISIYDIVCMALAHRYTIFMVNLHISIHGVRIRQHSYGSCCVCMSTIQRILYQRYTNVDGKYLFNIKYLDTGEHTSICHSDNKKRRT